MQAEYARKYELRCIVGNAPSLNVISDAYGDCLTKAWLMLQIIKLNKNVLGSDTSKKMTPEQIEVTADTILSNYGHLKCTDIMLYFNRFMAGKHGKFYGTVDIVVLTQGLDNYCDWRTERIAEYQKQKDKEKGEQITKEIFSDRTMNRVEWENSFEYQKIKMTMPQDVVDKIENFAKRFA